MEVIAKIVKCYLWYKDKEEKFYNKIKKELKLEKFPKLIK